ncbi:MAG: hypothetical protein JW743_04225 [Deltaproteobacteria bacterium]|nr:hypothetical protein [Deltaproteobacteria bacterium]MBN2846659.1 hypothetical protein [Deltaproteobacteria bacterium]
MSEKQSLESIVAPWLFKHIELIDRLDSAPKINHKKLINILNHLHFTDGHLFVHMKEIQYGEDLLIPVLSDPCYDGIITCRWVNDQRYDLEKYRLLNLVILDGLSVLLAPAILESSDRESFSIRQPDTVYVLGKRKAKRYYCHGVHAELIQNGFAANGFLLDFNALAFRIRVTPNPDFSFHWFNPEAAATINLYRKDKLIFSGACKYIRQTSSIVEKEIVFAPVDNEISRIKKKRKRSNRLQLTPSPSVSFFHPFFKKKVQRDIHDISITGFSVHEFAEQGVLVPGMILPKMEINFSGSLKIKCAAQVIYCKKEKKGLVRCGLVILDMNFPSYGKLSNILISVIDSRIRISDEVDLDALWKFFFDANFIYSKKYKSIQLYRNDFKKTYGRLYRDNPEIAQHLTYQKNGQIYGHVSMVRAYQEAWMIHHLAAKPMGKKHTGLPILKQLLNYFDGIYRLPSVKMSHMIFYFRSQNRFMKLFFGGFARDLDNLNACSMDLFAYDTYKTASSQNSLPDEWTLNKFDKSDLLQLEHFYRNHSGGLLLNVLKLGDGNPCDEPLEKVYARQDLIRKSTAYSLRFKDRLQAAMIVNQSDLGLNLSELLNGIKIIVTDSRELPWDVLSSAISQLAPVYNIDSVPIMIYPHTYLEERGISYEKQYLMWILDTQYGKEYLEYMQERTKLKIRYLVKFLIEKLLK